MGKEGKYDLKLAPGLEAGDEEESDCNVSCTNNGGKNFNTSQLYVRVQTRLECHELFSLFF